MNEKTPMASQYAPPPPPPPAWGAPPPPPAKPARRGRVIAAVAGGLLIGAGIYAFTVLSPEDNNDARPGTSTSRPTAEPSTAPTVEPTVAPTEEPAELGTKENPYPINTPIEVDDWTYTFGPTDTDHWPELYETKSDYQRAFDAPAPGMQYVNTYITVTYDGIDQRQRWGGIFFFYVSPDGVEHFPGGSCGPGGTGVEGLPESDLVDIPHVEGNMCVALPPEQANGGLWKVHTFVNDPPDQGGITEYEFYIALQ